MKCSPYMSPGNSPVWTLIRSLDTCSMISRASRFSNQHCGIALPAQARA
jgi:hypothetical protein